ncbi:MAG: hypothetical protein ACT4PG_00675 [Panacagrimonas sp.]
MDPLQAPKRNKLPKREEESRSGSGALILIVVFVVVLGGVIAYLDKQSAGDSLGGVVELHDAGGGSRTGFISPGLGERKAMKEVPLEQAKPLQLDQYAAPVSHVRDTDICSSLRSARARVQENMAKPHSAAQAAEYKLDLRSVSERGTKEGCWSGGAG